MIPKHFVTLCNKSKQGMDKFEKRVVCEYCESSMESINRNKRFCSDKCRVYWNRENPKVVKPVNPPEPQNEAKEEPTQKEEFSSFSDYRKKKLGIK